MRTSTPATTTAIRHWGQSALGHLAGRALCDHGLANARDIMHPVELTRFGDALQGVRPVAF
jgi:hypothetical protein